MMSLEGCLSENKDSGSNSRKARTKFGNLVSCRNEAKAEVLK